MLAWGKPDDRRSSANQVQPANAGQAEVDHRQVMVEFVGPVQRFFRVGDRIDHMAAFAQPGM